MHLRLLIGTCAAAALIGAAACSNENAPRTDTTTPPPASAADTTKGTSGSDDTHQQPITLTGCLQKGDGSAYILTELSEPSAGKASPADANKVEREQINAAEHAYRLSAAKDTNDDDWDKLVGKKVKVEGTLAKRADIDDHNKVGTTGNSSDLNRADTKANSNDRDRVKIKEGDLAQVDVNSLQQVANACGNGSAKRARPRTK
jgi:hypothetical protein